MPSLNVRAASSKDLPRIVELKLAMFRESGHAHLLAPNADSVILADYERLYANAEAQHFVGCSAGHPVACAGAFLKSDLPFRYFSPSSYGFVGDVYTDPEFRRAGLAKQLSEEVLAWLEAKGVRMVRLLASAQGRSLYEKLGFVPSEEMVRTDAT